MPHGVLSRGDLATLVLLDEKLTLLLGARLDNHQNFGLNLTPRAYVVYTPGRALTSRRPPCAS
jgi:outer membrane receptor for ferrienterochelin and colicin